jgi:hypothetical protein
MIQLPTSGNTIRYYYTIKGSFASVYTYLSVVLAIAALVVSGGIIEAPLTIIRLLELTAKEPDKHTILC